MIPYGKQCIDEADIQAVVEVLRSDFLTTGPKVAEFEQAVAGFVRAEYGVAVSNGTAALHCAMHAIDIRAGDEVILPPITFAATANCVIYQGGIPVFADVVPETLLIDPEKIDEKITANTKAIIGVDYAGQPCDWDRLKAIADKHNLILIADGCHALGAEYNGRKVGSLADLTVFSFHPVKHITTGEGGMIATGNPMFADKIKRFRNHGIDIDFKHREAHGSWIYQIGDLGYNYRLTDMQCALGIRQLEKLPAFLEKRRSIAQRYDRAFSQVKGVSPLQRSKKVSHAYHLYVVRLTAGIDRRQTFSDLQTAGIGVNVHYIPLHYHPLYKSLFGYDKGDFPCAEKAYEQIISLPIYPEMSDEDVNTVVDTLSECVAFK